MAALARLRARFYQALSALEVDARDSLSLIQPASNRRFGDYQANCAMPLAKQLRQAPPAVAARIVAALDVSDFCETPSVAGPGFINLRLRDDWLIDQLRAMVGDDRLGHATAPSPRTYVIDFSSPNVAKPMHVGHIRSTVLGDALARILRFVGHRVITDNHLGDWGTQFGMIIFGFRHLLDQAAYRSEPVAELGRLYRLVRQGMDGLDAREQIPKLQEQLRQRRGQLSDLHSTAAPRTKDLKQRMGRLQNEIADLEQTLAADEESAAQLDAARELKQLIREHGDIRQAVLEETAKLHAGDPDNRRIWQEVLPDCRADIQRVYDRLQVGFDHELGESFYDDQLADVVASLEQNGLVQVSDATCVFLDGFETPMIVRKRDGAFLYATTDLATIAYRVQQWHPDVILYVVDFRQSEHFEKLFAAASRWLAEAIELRHIRFGTILGADQRPFKTRAGDTVGLLGLLDEAERRALQVVQETQAKKPADQQVSPARQRDIARVVGIGAIKYTDLSQNRTSDYVFDYDKMLSLQGNTATYLQYSYARVHGIFAKGQVDPADWRDSPPAVLLSTDIERELAVRLLQFSEALDDVLIDFRPNLLTAYLYELAKCFSSFFETCPVLNAETPALRHSRLVLCDLTARTLKTGLQLLGIEVVEQM